MGIEELKKLGFRHRYIPNIKKVDETLLGYVYLFKAGNCISIDLRYVEKINKWVVNHINVEGDDALQLIRNELLKFDLFNVVEFVRKHPYQTF